MMDGFGCCRIGTMKGHLYIYLPQNSRGQEYYRPGPLVRAATPIISSVSFRLRVNAMLIVAAIPLSSVTSPPDRVLFFVFAGIDPGTLPRSSNCPPNAD